MTEVYEASPVKRRRTTAELEQLDRQIVAVLEEDNPQSLRHVFYRMTDPRLPVPIEKTDLGYERIAARLKILRRNGTVPYGWLVDTSRSGIFTPTYKSVGDFLESVAGGYRADIWMERPEYCEVWVESRSIAGVIEEVCDDLAVSLYPAGGFASITFTYEAAETINREHDGRGVVIFYIGDYDPAGVLIDVALERELREHLDPEVSLTFRRLGITAEQVRRLRLPSKPRRASDVRAQHIKRTVEAEAMPAHLMRELLRDAIEKLLPRGTRERARKAEARARATLRELAVTPKQ
jgi:hypothetical protein